MPPFVALSSWLILLLALLYYDPAADRRASLALWVPLIWMFIIQTRLPSQWLGVQLEAGSVAQVLQEGNPVDRVLLSLLMLTALGILAYRSFRWDDFFSRNLALMAYLSFALLSVLWSDFALISFKRWLRDLGSYLAILVILTDPRPLEAVRTVFRRLCYLTIPLSILLIKYYDKIGKVYDPWTGVATYVGATTSKNMLGGICLISGIFFFWDTVMRWADRHQRQTKRILFVNFASLFYTAYLLKLARSATSDVCLVLGCLVIAAAHHAWFKRHPGFLKVMLPVSFFIYVIVGFGLGLNGYLAAALGKDPTFTDRTKIWSIVLGMHTNPLVGRGYESFWLGPRLDYIWKQFGVRITEAHNGYIEVYLNLGSIGLFLLAIFLIASYRNICSQRLGSRANFASLAIGLWTIALFYNVSEAAFKYGSMWLALLLGGISLRASVRHQVREVTESDQREAVGILPVLS